MLYIISGASRSGKSIIAKKLMKTTGIPYLPLDSLVMGFTNGVPEMGINDKLWPNEIADKLWRFLNPVCENMLYNNMDFIIEGEAINPKQAKELFDKFPDQVKIVFIGYDTVAQFDKVQDVKNYPQKDNDWLNNEKDEVIFNHVDNMIKYSVKLKKECEKYHLKYFNTSKEFQANIDLSIKYLTN